MQPYLVELVGPAGVGKTTLAQALIGRSARARLGVLPYYRNARQAPFFVRHTLLSLPLIARLYRQQHTLRCLNRSELSWLVILDGWHRQLRRPVPDGRDIIVLDHGPVFMLAALYAYGSRVLLTAAATKWWALMYSRWASALDLVVWLDASNPTLAQRIRHRDQPHQVKDEPDDAVYQFLAEYRKAYDRTLAALRANGCGPRLLCLNTEELTLDETATRILSTCGPQHAYGGSKG